MSSQNSKWPYTEEEMSLRLAFVLALAAGVVGYGVYIGDRPTLWDYMNRVHRD